MRIVVCYECRSAFLVMEERRECACGRAAAVAGNAVFSNGGGIHLEFDDAEIGAAFLDGGGPVAAEVVAPRASDMVLVGPVVAPHVYLPSLKPEIVTGCTHVDKTGRMWVVCGRAEDDEVHLTAGRNV